MDPRKRCLKVVMFPWLAHGHISPFVELAKRLSVWNFRCYICSTPVNLASIQSKIPREYSVSVHLVELHLPSTPELPPHYHTTNGLPLGLHSGLRRALKMAKPDFLSILNALQPDLLVHDILQPWAGTMASRCGIPSVAFFTSGATMFSYFCHLAMHPGIEFPFPAIGLSSFELSMVRNNMESATSEEKDPDDEVYERGHGIILVNSSREMEGKYMDYLSKMIRKEIVPIGAHAEDPKTRGQDDSELMEWLGEKDKHSTVFVSFGTEYFLSKEDIEELAHGLELSNVNFIWTLRFPKGDNMKIDEVMPQGFLQRVGERGRIVENWAPQAKILNHSSVGGFVSHCGWNSLKESIEYGVPIIAMPMHLDQPMNAKLLVEMGVGVEVGRDDNGRLQRGEISRMIKHVVMNGKSGEDLRRRIDEQRGNIRLTSKKEMEGVAKMLEHLCRKNC